MRKVKTASKVPEGHYFSAPGAGRPVGAGLEITWYPKDSSKREKYMEAMKNANKNVDLQSVSYQ